jgi:hypothetical protein
MMKKIKEKESKEVLIGVKLKKSIQKWFFRTQATQRRRRILKIMNIDKQKRLIIMTFQALQWRKRVAFDLNKALGGLEEFLNRKQVEEGISCLKSYYRSKKSTKVRRDKRGLGDILSILCHRNYSLTERYF